MDYFANNCNLAQSYNSNYKKRQLLRSRKFARMLDQNIENC